MSRGWRGWAERKESSWARRVSGLPKAQPVHLETPGRPHSVTFLSLSSQITHIQQLKTTEMCPLTAWRPEGPDRGISGAGASGHSEEGPRPLPAPGGSLRSLACSAWGHISLDPPPSTLVSPFSPDLCLQSPSASSDLWLGLVPRPGLTNTLSPNKVTFALPRTPFNLLQPLCSRKDGPCRS